MSRDRTGLDDRVQTDKRTSVEASETGMLIDGSLRDEVDHLVGSNAVVAHSQVDNDGGGPTDLLPVLSIGDMYKLLGQLRLLALDASALLLDVVPTLGDLGVYTVALARVDGVCDGLYNLLRQDDHALHCFTHVHNLERGVGRKLLH